MSKVLYTGEIAGLVDMAEMGCTTAGGLNLQTDVCTRRAARIYEGMSMDESEFKRKLVKALYGTSVPPDLVKQDLRTILKGVDSGKLRGDIL